MAYQNVGTPRFYIDLLSYNQSIGNIDSIKIQNRQLGDAPYFTSNENKELLNLIDLEPSNTYSMDLPFDYYQRYKINVLFENPIKMLNQNAWFGFLNHNASSSSANAYLWGSFLSAHQQPASLNFQDGSMEDILNCSLDGYNGVTSDYHQNGCSIMTGTPYSNDQIGGFSANIEVHDTDIKPAYFGCICFGSYYDMPNSPDLDLSMPTEFDGYDSTTTLGGSTLTNVRYAGAPWWYDTEGNKVEPWSIGTSPGTSKRNGRRMWSMKFSYMSDKDIFASNYMSNTYLETSTDYESDDLTTDNNNFEYTLENDNSFIAQVLNKVGNGQRFIFQPDNTNNNPDQFAICQLDQDSLSIKQVAYKVYDISLKIREVW